MSALSRPTNAPDWRRGAVIYQIYPRSFADSNGDGVGDLPGIAARLDYVASLGVDAIWLSPFFVSPMRDFGYDVADPYDVDPVFGTLADFDVLLAKAHGLGLKVIIDQVYCHLSDRHPWFQESRSSRDNPKADWFVWADPKPDGSPPTNWRSVFHGPSWTWDARRGQYYLHNFLPEQPDLNVHHPAVQEALLAIARFWLDRGVDGFRLDAINFLMHDPLLRDNPPAPCGRPRSRPFDFQSHLYNQSHPAIPAFLERLQAVVDEQPGRFTVAEIGGERALEEMRDYTLGDRRLETAYSFDFLYAPSLTPERVRRAMQAWSPEASPGGWPSWAFSNHDAPRAVSRWWPNADPAATAPLALLLLLCLRGNVFLYQGEELGLPQAEVPFDRLRDPEAIANWPATLGRDGARTPMPWTAAAPHAGFSAAEPWLPLDPRHAALSVDRQEADPGSILAFARKALALRASQPALKTGAFDLRDAPEGVLAFTRGDEGQVLTCVFNLDVHAGRRFPPPRGRVLLGTPGLATGETAPETLGPLQGYVSTGE
jgi:alpha-glucosidase